MEKQTNKLELLHVAIYVSDYDRSVEFYEKGLGCTFVRQWGERGERTGIYALDNGTAVELFERPQIRHAVPDTECTGAVWHFAIQAEDVDAAFARAVEHGATVHNEPYDGFHDSIPAPVYSRNAFVFGPDRELIEFYRLRQPE